MASKRLPLPWVFALLPKSQTKQILQTRNLSFWGNGLQKAINRAEKLVDYPSAFLGLQFLLGNETVNFAALAKRLVGTGHPLLATSRDLIGDEYYSSRMGGLWVLLVSKATNVSTKLLQEEQGPTNGNGILLKQRRLAGITETIGVAYLIHRGMLTFDESTTSTHDELKTLKFGNKLAVLGGDYLLARACTDLAKINNVKVVEQISTGLEDIVQGASLDLDEESRQQRSWEEYLLKCHGSLLGYSCQAAVTLGGHDDMVQREMYEFGNCIGMIQTLFFDMKAFENGKNTKFSETNAVISLELRRDPSLRTSTPDITFLPSKDIYQNCIIVNLDERQRNAIIERAGTKLNDYITRATQTAEKFTDKETKTVICNILDQFKV